MEHNRKIPPIALGTWSWGVGFAGGDQVFGNHLGKEDLKAVFDTAMENGLNLWDTAVVYGMGASEDVLGSFTKTYPRENMFNCRCLGNRKGSNSNYWRNKTGTG